MENKPNYKPPRFAIVFFRWFCQPGLHEEIEGDLLELFHKHAEQYGLKKARIYFIKNVFLLFRPAIIGNSRHLIFNQLSNMKVIHWMQLIALNLLVALCILLPFLPGPYDKLSLILSGTAQVTGFIGLIGVPVGVLWLINEIKKIAGNHANTNNWNSGYYYAITATFICTFICLVFLVALLMSFGPSAAVVSLLVIAVILYKMIRAVKKLKQATAKIFNPAPLYLLSIPIIAFTVRMFFMSAVSDYSRNYAIEQGQLLINDIENYYTQKGNYPESIYTLYNTPRPSIMGISEFRYERNGNAYNLSFVQWQHVGATAEVVMYNKNDQHNIKGHFASYHARQPHWRYFWLD